MPTDDRVNSGQAARPGEDLGGNLGGDPARRAVRAAVAAAGMTLKQASRALGRNDAYLQQYLYRGTPRRLPEQLRLRLAAITATDQADFLDPALRALRPPADGVADGAVPVPLHAVRAAAGGGSVADETGGSRESLAFPPALLRRITAAPAAGLKLLTISGDSMSPTLEDGDLVMVDTQRRLPSPPGIFILDDGVGLVAKRVDAIPNSWPLALRLSSDNPAYSNYRRRVDEVHIVGRVVWFARSI